MAHIVPMILDRVSAHLETILTPERYPDNLIPERIKIGRFQEDPVKTITFVALHPGDPEDPSFRDGIVTLGEMNDIGMNVEYPREIGWGEFWWRRFSAQIGCYWIRERLDEMTAMDNSYVILGRVSDAIETVSLSGIIDEFFEEPIQLFLYKSKFFEGGGKNQYLWRGIVSFQVLTARSRS